MSDSEVHKLIVEAVAAAIAEKEGGVPLTMAAAYDIAQTISLGYHRGTKVWDDEKALSRAAHSTTFESYTEARKLTARQFIGSTLASILEDIGEAAKRFPVSADSDGPPDLVDLAQFPDKIDFWNLLAYATAIRHVAYRDLEKAGADMDSDKELIGIESAVQLLHMLTQQDIHLSDLTDKPFDGDVRQ
ncbi:hypothetical protein [Rhizobium sp. BK176]|uniref:hypothetical protein n=1 Tax=Rhizobium sp. BK176 TaxID=2587071 RepID=UPI00216A3B15|nr:hypothetical protein [Rhizobium sp. BK176]MCS4089135.1 hypothetical protein [Rhizobium sp. BK176]